MTQSTPGFIGERLAEARTARGLSATDLADMVSISVQTLSKYENGHQSPKQKTFFKLSSVLNFPHAYFLRKSVNDDCHPVFWRGKLSAPQGMQERAKVRLKWTKEIVDYLMDFFDFPELNIPKIPIDEVDLVHTDFLEEVAKEIRSQWNITSGPMPNIVEKLESNGVFTSRIHVRAEKLDAFSQWSDKFNMPIIMLGRDKSSAVRQRFDAAHELSHIVIHGKVTQKMLNTKATYKKLEKQADQLAGMLLLPDKEFLDELYAPSLDAFLSLKERWGVSVGAMIMKCKKLGIIDEKQTSRMFINYTRRGWRKSEPLDNMIKKEEPKLIKRSFEILLSEGIQSISDIKNALPFPLSEIEEIAELEKGILGEDNSITAAPKLKKDSSNVVKFNF